MTPLEDLIESFVAYHRAMNHSEATIRHYLDSLKLFNRYLAESDIEATAECLTNQTFTGFASWLRITPTKPWRGKTERSIWGVHGALKDCKAWVRWLAEEELIDKAPKIPVPMLPQQLFPVPTGAELDTIFASPQVAGTSEIAIRNRALVAFLLDTGVRLSEASRLQLDDLDLKDGMAIVTGKGNKQRQVYFSASAAEAIRRWLTIRGDSEGEVFWLSGSGIRQVLERIRRETGIEVLHAHQLRHTAFTMMVRAGADLHTIKRIAGHASVTTTEGYLALAGQDVKDKHTASSPFDAIHSRHTPTPSHRRRLSNKRAS